MTVIAKSAKTHPAAKNDVAGKKLPYVQRKNWYARCHLRPCRAFFIDTSLAVDRCFAKIGTTCFYFENITHKTFIIIFNLLRCADNLRA